MANNGVSGDYQTLKNDVAQLQKDLGVLVGSLKEEARTRTDRAKADASASVAASKDSLVAAATDAEQEVKRQFEEKPLLFLLASFIIGMLIGKAVSR